MKFARKQLAAAAIAMIATTVHAADPVPAFEPDPCPDGDAVLAAQTPADKALQLRVEGALGNARPFSFSFPFTTASYDSLIVPAPQSKHCADSEATTTPTH